MLGAVPLHPNTTMHSSTTHPRGTQRLRALSPAGKSSSLEAERAFLSTGGPEQRLYGDLTGGIALTRSSDGGFDSRRFQYKLPAALSGM
jgi:hypothetical protein